MSRHNVVAIVLGGGRGSRLYPLTDQRSKPAVPIAGKYRLVDIPISNCLNSGFNKIFVLSFYFLRKVLEQLDKEFQVDKELHKQMS